jgi:hypothetical protein
MKMRWKLSKESFQIRNEKEYNKALQMPFFAGVQVKIETTTY